MRDCEIRMCQPSCSMMCYKYASNYSGEQQTALDWWIRRRSLQQEEFMVYEGREKTQFGGQQPAGGGSLWKRREPREVCRGLGAFDALLYGLAAAA